MSLSKIEIWETSPWNDLNLLSYIEGQVWIENWVYHDEENEYMI